jgi:hypothetical protein
MSVSKTNKIYDNFKKYLTEGRYQSDFKRFRLIDKFVPDLETVRTLKADEDYRPAIIKLLDGEVYPINIEGGPYNTYELRSGEHGESIDIVGISEEGAENYIENVPVYLGRPGTMNTGTTKTTAHGYEDWEVDEPGDVFGYEDEDETIPSSFSRDDENLLGERDVNRILTEISDFIREVLDSKY